MEGNKFTPLNNQIPTPVSGNAAASRSRWDVFVHRKLLPRMNSLAGKASGSDRTVVEGCIDTLQHAGQQGDPIGFVIRRMWLSYQYSDREAIQDSGVRAELERLLRCALEASVQLHI